MALDFLFIQILGIAYAAGMLYFAYSGWRRHELTRGDFYIWSLAWVGFIFALIFTDILEKFRQFLGIGGGPLPFFTIAGFMFLTGIVFYLYQRVRINSRKLERIVQRIAWDKIKTK